MNVPKDLMYTNDHEWAKFEDNKVKIGITDFAQGEHEQTASRLCMSIKEYIGVSAKINVLPEGAVPRSAGKAQRVIDNR